MGYEYHDFGALRHLGERIRDKAVEVTMRQYTNLGYDDYGDAQTRATNYPYQNPPGTGPLEQYGYTPAARGRQDDYDNLKRFVSAENASIPELFTAFSIPDPTAAQSTVDSLYQTAAGLSPNLKVTVKDGKPYAPMLDGTAPPSAPVETTVNYMKTHLQHWDGDAALAFKGYLDNFTVAAGLQYDFACALAITMDIQLEIRKRLLTDVWDIGNKTLKVLDSLTGVCPSPQKIGVEITVWAAAVGILGAIPSGGAATVSAVGWLVGTLMTMPVSKPPTDSVGGQSVVEVIQSMHRLLVRVAEGIDSQQQELVTVLRKLSTQVTTDSQLVEPVAPAKLSGLTTAGVDVLDTGRAFYDR
jgi:hypothetical protein